MATKSKAKAKKAKYGKKAKQQEEKGQDPKEQSRADHGYRRHLDASRRVPRLKNAFITGE